MDVKASEVLAAQHHANYVGNHGPTFDPEGQVAALLACGGPDGVAIRRADEVLVPWEPPTLRDHEQATIDLLRQANRPNESMLIAIIDRLVPPSVPPSREGE